MVGSFALIVFLNCQLITVLKGAFHYVFLIPTYINIFMIYSICNIHDCTWGNRPDSLSHEEKERLEEFEEFRTRWAVIWGISNVILIYALLFTAQANDISTKYFMTGFFFFAAFLLSIRMIGGFLYFFSESCKKSIKERYEVKPTSIYNRGTTHIVFNNSISN